MFSGIFILIIIWSWTINLFTVESRIVYLRNGRTINIRGANKFACYLMLVCAIYLTGSFIFTHVIPLF